MPGSSDYYSYEGIYNDPEVLANQFSSSYDKRVEICTVFIEHMKMMNVVHKEEELREKHPGIQQAYEQYKMLLELVE